MALALLVMCLPARAVEADEWYLQVYGVIEQADSLSTSGQTDKAKAKYVEAEKALKELKQNYPLWSPKLVTARLNYLAGKITTLSLPPQAPAGDTNDAKTATGGSKAVGPGQPQLKLLEAGAEPRKVFRIQTKAGDTQKATMTVKIGMGMNAPDMPGTPMKMPTMKMALGVTTKSVEAEGDINYEFRLEEVEVVSEPGVLSQVADAMKESLKGIKGLVVAGTMTDRGISKKVEAKVPAGTDAQTRESMEQMKQSLANATFLLPEEAIGVGAKWEVKEKLKEQGMTMDQVTRQELTAIDGDALTTKMTVTQSAANQKIANPLMPALKVDMTKMTGAATGSMLFNVGKILPVKMTMDDHSEINMAINAGGKKQAMAMKTDTNVSLESE